MGPGRLENLRYATAKNTSATTRRASPSTTEKASIKTPRMATMAKSASILLTSFLAGEAPDGGGAEPMSSFTSVIFRLYRFLPWRGKV